MALVEIDHRTEKPNVKVIDFYILLHRSDVGFSKP
jgi:hypothetical protein